MSSNIDLAHGTLDERRELYDALTRYDKWKYQNWQSLGKPENAFYGFIMSLEFEYIESIVGALLLKKKESDE